MKNQIIIFSLSVFVLVACLFLLFGRNSAPKPRVPQQASQKIEEVPPPREFHHQSTVTPEFHSEELAATFKPLAGDDFRELKRFFDQHHDLILDEVSLVEVAKFIGTKNVPNLGAHLVLANQALSLAQNQLQMPEEVFDILAGLIIDDRLAPELRGYTLQHLSTWYERTPVPSQKPKMVRMFIEHASHANADIAGTSLLALSRISQDYPKDVESGVIKQLARNLAEDESMGSIARIAAVQVCGELGMGEMLPLVMDLALHGEPVLLRMAALATVGEIGNQDERPFLLEIAASPEPRLQIPAQTALGKLSSKN